MWAAVQHDDPNHLELVVCPSGAEVTAVFGVCTGSDNGAGGTCNNNAARTLCAVAGPGNNCVFAADAVTLSTRQSIPAGTSLTFTTLCALNGGSSACAVTGPGPHDCVYEATALTLDSAQDIAAGATVVFNEAVPCANATLCDYTCGYCASAAVEVRGQLHVADTVRPPRRCLGLLAVTSATLPFPPRLPRRPFLLSASGRSSSSTASRASLGSGPGTATWTWP